MNQWKINKYGFVNFWLFDDEQIETANGNLLLSGENGSGKSVTLQSFIPLLLDGNTNSNRLSTEGDTSRKIDWYLLYGEKEQNISYLYLEFEKEEFGKKKYVTFGIGFKIRKGQRAVKWYFKINDLRIGKDIELYKREFGENLIFEKKDLKKRFEKDADGKHTFFNTRTEYKMDVNQTIFGFDDIDEFEETLNLILELRKPNLKDASGFDPKFIYKILNSSLKALPESDLMTMSESFENIERISEDLKRIEIQHKAINNIKKHYKLYNELVLKERVDSYIKSNQKFEKEKRDINDKTQALKKTEEIIDKSNIRMDKLEQEKKNKISRKLELESNREFKDIQNSYEIVQNKLKELKEKKEYLEMSYKKLKTRMEESENKLDETKRETEFNEIQMKTFLNEIKEIKSDLMFESIINFEDFFNYEKKIDVSIIDEEFREFEAKIKEVIKQIKEKEKLIEEKKKLLDWLSESEERGNNNRIEYMKHLEKMKDKKDTFVEKIDEMKSTMKELNISKSVMGDLEEEIDVDSETCEKHLVIEPIKEMKREIENVYFGEKNKKETDKNEIKKEIEQLEKKILKLKSEKDLDLEIDYEFVKEREKLEKGNYLEFYKAIKFRDNVEEGIKNSIEKALLDSGLLSAIITQENSKDVFDKFIRKSDKKRENLTKFLETEECFDTNLVYEILESISIEKDNATYICPDGSYRLGVLSGEVRKDYQAKYIGIEARKKLKDVMIKKLNDEIEAERDKIVQIDLYIEEILDKKELLNREYRRVEAIFDEFEFDKLNKDIRANIYGYQNIKFEIEKWKKSLEELKLKMEKVEENISKILTAYRLPITNYEKSEQNIIKFREKYTELKSLYKDRKNLLQAKELWITNRDEINDDLMVNRREKKLIAVNIQENKDKKAIYEESLKNDKYRDFLREIEELNERINVELPNTMLDLSKKIGIRESNVMKWKKDLEELEKTIKYSEKDNSIKLYLLEEELSNDYTGLNENFEKIEDKIRLRERLRKRIGNEINKEEAFSHLSLAVTHEERNLGAYHMGLNSYIYDDDKLGGKFDEYIASRSVLTGVMGGKKVTFNYITRKNAEHLEATNDLLDSEERKFFEEFLFNEIGRGINRRVNESREWVEKIDKKMQETPTSSGKRYKLLWQAKLVDQADGTRADSFIKILGNSHSKDSNKIKIYFKNKMTQLKEEKTRRNELVSNYELIKEVLDYRNWFNFKLEVLESGETNWKHLTKSKLNSFSGGEKVMAVYIPLFSALYARFANAKEDSLKIVSMDEAFSVVDDENIEKLFSILDTLGLNYLLASQKLTGTYKSIKDLAIVHIENPVSKQLVDPKNGYISLIKYLWNGKEKVKDMRGVVGTLY